MVDLPAPLGPTTQVIPPSSMDERQVVQHVAATVSRGDAVELEQRVHL